jgi:hypothetical protein
MPLVLTGIGGLASIDLLVQLKTCSENTEFKI